MSDKGALGEAAYIAFNGTVLDTNFRTFSQSESIDLVDQSAGADTAKTYLTSLTDGSAPLTFKYKAGDTAQWGAVALGAEGTLECGAEGTAAGKPRSYVNAIVSGRTKSMSYNDLIVVDVTFQYSGTVTDGTY